MNGNKGFSRLVVIAGPLWDSAMYFYLNYILMPETRAYVQWIEAPGMLLWVLV